MTGYFADGLADDGSVLRDRPGFWAVHLGLALGDGLDQQLAELFGADLRAMRGTYLRLTDPDGWPVFRVDTSGGAQLAVVYRNVEPEESVDYLLLPAAGEPITVAVAEGVPDGPGLSWPELLALAERQSGPAAQARTLLLLAPILGDVAASEPAVVARLCGALRTAGVLGDVAEIAGRVTAAAPARWRTEDTTRCCDHPGSVRNPDSTRAGTPAVLRSISDALSAPP
ncbi:hypothetical protein ACWKSP_31275 [Micromonosporaceae bacterium Da 78-11]